MKKEELFKLCSDPIFIKNWITNKEKIQHLWNIDSHCFWCGKETIIFSVENGISPRNAATLDHLFPKPDTRRKLFKNMNKGRISSPVVLSCYSCNNKRNKDQLENFVKKNNKDISEVLRNAYYFQRIFE